MYEDHYAVKQRSGPVMLVVRLWQCNRDTGMSFVLWSRLTPLLTPQIPLLAFINRGDEKPRSCWHRFVQKLLLLWLSLSFVMFYKSLVQHCLQYWPVVFLLISSRNPYNLTLLKYQKSYANFLTEWSLYTHGLAIFLGKDLIMCNVVYFSL